MLTYPKIVKIDAGDSEGAQLFYCCRAFECLMLFPAFHDLPVCKELPDAFYSIRFDGFPSPKRHWAFVGEVVDDSMCLDKKRHHRTIVRDRNGIILPVVFLFEKDAPTTFKFRDVKKGSSMFVMYAEREKIDAEEGIRVEALDYVAIVPLELKVRFWVSLF
jgi:hypothetical protein